MERKKGNFSEEEMNLDLKPENILLKQQGRSGIKGRKERDYEDREN